VSSLPFYKTVACINPYLDYTVWWKPTSTPTWTMIWSWPSWLWSWLFGLIFALYRGCRFRTMARLLSCEYDLTIPEMSRTSPQVIPLQPSHRCTPSFVFLWCTFSGNTFNPFTAFSLVSTIIRFLLGTFVRKHPVTVRCVSVLRLLFFSMKQLYVSNPYISSLFIKFAHLFALLMPVSPSN
jgi:hypothetical protein